MLILHKHGEGMLSVTVFIKACRLLYCDDIDIDAARELL